MTYLVDTNVISELRKPRPNAHVQRWMAETPGTELYINVLILGELRIGIELRRRRDPAQAAKLGTWLEKIRTDFKDRIVPITEEICDVWVDLNVPNRLPTADSLIAATAITYGWTLATRNIKDMERTGVTILNPFEPISQKPK